jgi:hypothetical protein
MTDLNRRHLLAGAVAAGAATAVTPLATSTTHAAAPQSSTQAPGFYRYKVGDFEISVVTDGAATFPLPDNFVQNHPKGEVQKALESVYQPTGTVTVPFTPIVINTGSKLVLIDAATEDGRIGADLRISAERRLNAMMKNEDCLHGTPVHPC